MLLNLHRLVDGTILNEIHCEKRVEYGGWSEIRIANLN
jgi:hypothetical protein